jgi:hypothetical protein
LVGRQSERVDTQQLRKQLEGHRRFFSAVWEACVDITATVAALCLPRRVQYGNKQRSGAGALLALNVPFWSLRTEPPKMLQ